MKINGASILKSLLFISILFIIFAFSAYVLKGYIYNDSKNSLVIKSDDTLLIRLDNNLPLSDKLALENNKDSVSGEIFKNIQFDVVNNSSKSVNYELYITKEEITNEINGKFIKMFLTKANGDLINGFDSNNVSNYDGLNVIDNLPGSRILYRGTIKGNSIEAFDFKTWISDLYENKGEKEEFIFEIRVRVI